MYGPDGDILAIIPIVGNSPRGDDVSDNWLVGCGGAGREGGREGGEEREGERKEGDRMKVRSSIIQPR